jgi:Fe2+ transport system protein FeoA
MSDDNQIDIPASFIALFVAPGRQKPSEPRHVVAGRYELCEDMATTLTETAKNMLFSLGISEHEVLVHIQRGLTGDNSVVSVPEAQWVIQRLAELLEWEFDPALLT